ncbi:hypothetical protein Hypma_011954 [Hypsizygus marmoreus]|uniref:MYND-type domain-containing protein n=1 Tax=Hypsizygus marmoreus TaxID=39966 RepID=A0A369JNH7_HYPMA|nr:hypothetical protein Hypma_011954 [Hypsizygus marmoreus]
MEESLESFEARVEEVKAEPNRFFEAACRGSQSELSQFAACWGAIPEVLTMSPLRAFIPHLAVSPGEADASGVARFRALFSLRGISVAGGHLRTHNDFVAQILEAWPLILNWLHFFEATSFLPKAQSSQASKGDDVQGPYSNLLILTALLHCLCTHPLLYRKVVSTKGLLDLAMKLWLLERFDDRCDLTLTQYIGTTAALATYLQYSDNTRVTAEKISKIEGCDPAKVTALALARLSITCAVREFSADMTAALLNTIQQLSSNSPFSEWFIRNNSIEIISNILSALCNRLRQGQRDMVQPALLCLGYLSKNLELGFDITPPSEAIESGLLWGFVECSPYLDGPMPKGVSALSVKGILSRILPIYMTYRSAVQAVYDSTIQRPYDLGKIKGSVVKDSWECFLHLVTVRYNQMQGIPLTAIGCDNDLCPEDVKYDAKLMNCTGCRSVRYCSKQCQVFDWKNGHKSLCKAAAEERSRGILAMQTLRRRDRAFQYVLTTKDAVCKRDFLRTLAAQKYPGVALTKMVVLIDYTVFPPIFSLKHIDEYEYEVVSNSISDETRITRKLGHLRHRPQDGITMVESLIPAGCFLRYVVTTRVKRLWDN